MIYTDSFNKVLATALDSAKFYRHEYVTPEHILNAMLQQEPFCIALEQCMCNSQELRQRVSEYLEKEIERTPYEYEYSQELSFQMNEMMNHAYKIIQTSGAEKMTIPHIVQGMLNLHESWAASTLRQTIQSNIPEFLGELTTQYDCYEELEKISKDIQPDSWQKHTTRLNEEISRHKPIIGRKNEIEQTIQTLCKKEKNNPLYIGEPGVGKRTLIIGLTALIESGKVPQRLQGYKIYELHLNNIMTLTQYRGDIEQRIKNIIDIICNEKKVIIYIDDIHNITADHSNDHPIDVSNIFKPYFENKELRFIGTTNNEEYNKHLSRNKHIINNFQHIYIAEPSIEESIKILEKEKDTYERFHGVQYEKNVIEYTVNAAAKFINNRQLPEKAIDLMDEAGSYCELHPTDHNKNIVNKEIINKILIQKYKIDPLHMEETENPTLVGLQTRITTQIYGQEEAIKQIVETIQISKAGLLDDNRPIANFLFIGTTGTGKTETAKVLAKELRMNLIRFDMSEYSEKHSVAKLIGPPAGYVGYDDGGILTEAIRKTPNCILLLDEIEKAHPDIFNLLLQVMDYATLTDNKGRKTDFRHTIIIMTSNVGAEYAHQSPIGFSGLINNDTTIHREVKRIFRPEFLNRLSCCILFNRMDKNTASAILDKKLCELKEKLSDKNIILLISDEAKELLLLQGYSPEYGAREIERTITHRLKKPLTTEILFGQLKNGGRAEIHTDGRNFTLKIET